MKSINCLKQTVFVLFFFLLSVLPRDAFSQDFSSINQDLTQLELLITDTLNNTEEQQRLLDDLKQNLTDSGILISGYENIILEQENLLSTLRIQLGEMSETYRKQSQLSARFEGSYRFWRTFTLIAVPLTALISGGIVYMVMH